MQALSILARRSAPTDRRGQASLSPRFTEAEGALGEAGSSACVCAAGAWPSLSLDAQSPAVLGTQLGHLLKRAALALAGAAQ